MNSYKVKSVKLSKTKYKYNGKKHCPIVRAKDITGKDIPSSKYSVKYEDNRKVGKHKVYITFNDGTKYTRNITVSK